MSRLYIVLVACYLSFCSFGSFASSIPNHLTISIAAAPDTGFDPILGWGKFNNPLIQSSLLTRTGDIHFKGDLAAKWQLSDNRLIWTVNLKPNIKFSDGKPLTAADVVFTFNQAKHAVTLHDLTNLAAVKAINPLTIQFTLKQPDITFIDNLANLAIVPKHAYDKEYGQHPIGSGPYQFVRWDKGQQLILKINPYYYGHKPEFKQLIFVFSGEDTRFAQLLAGQLDLAALPPRYALQLPAPYKLWRVQSVDNRGVAWPMEKFNGHDIGNDITADPAIRQAAELVINRAMLVDQLLDGYAQPAYSIADGLPWGISYPASKLTAAQKLQKAQAILAQAGWDIKDGVLTKGKRQAKLDLYYKSGDSIREQLALTVAQMLKPLGIEMTTHGESWEQISKVMHANPVLFGFGSHSATEVLYTYHSRYQGQDFYNAGYYHNKVVDQALDKAQQSTTWQQSLPYWQAAEKQIAQDHPWLWLVNLQHLYAANPCLDLAKPGIEPHGHGWPIVDNITDWRWTCR